MKQRNHIVCAMIKFHKRAGRMKDKKRLNKNGVLKHKKTLTNQDL